ncbi:hypothetical protein CY34DRAFT_399330 [Suillus luteus UH-Slu-Lm8-n1]|uniref:Uncharacterized protein n=1 Tax=Suillus luteus UH-Slu-Lm8-n1 TaxID=930992 RepID=A0A0D0AJH4_9AGAM|nr:hypothetical protein CY34DRAFT_399330 [Suillus luteus UH-Slu-Lm8-n1]
MFTRLFTAAIVTILGLTVLVDAGLVPAARAVGGPNKRSDAVGNYKVPGLYAEPLAEPTRRSEAVVSIDSRIKPHYAGLTLQYAQGNYKVPGLYAEPLAEPTKRAESPELGLDA